VELSGESVPRLVLRRADGWWDVVPGEHCHACWLVGCPCEVRMRRWLAGGSVLSCPPLVWLA
jgi:hypothetical protein